MYSKALQKNKYLILSIVVGCMFLGYFSVFETRSQYCEALEVFQCNESIEILLNEFKEIVQQKTMLQRKHYLEVKSLKQEIVELKKSSHVTSRECMHNTSRLEEDVKGKVHYLTELQTLLNGALSTMDRNSLVMVTMLRALKQAEERTDVLEHQLNNTTPVLPSS